MAGLAAGATLSPGMAGFYGHLVAWPARTWEPGVFALLSQYHSADAALVDINGQLIPQRGAITSTRSRCSWPRTPGPSSSWTRR